MHKIGMAVWLSLNTGWNCVFVKKDKYKLKHNSLKQLKQHCNYNVAVYKFYANTGVYLLADWANGNNVTACVVTKYIYSSTVIVQFLGICTILEYFQYFYFSFFCSQFIYIYKL